MTSVEKYALALPLNSSNNLDCSIKKPDTCGIRFFLFFTQHWEVVDSKSDYVQVVSLYIALYPQYESPNLD